MLDRIPGSGKRAAKAAESSAPQASSERADRPVAQAAAKVRAGLAGLQAVSGSTPQVDTSKLGQLKEKVEVAEANVRDRASELLGAPARQAGSTNVVDQLQGATGDRDRMGELLGPKGGGFAGSSLGRLSDDPPKDGQAPAEEEKSTGLLDFVFEAAKNALFGWATSKSPVPMPPVPPDPETGKDMHRGVTVLKDVLGKGDYANYIDQRGGIDKTPIRDSDAPSGHLVVTKDTLRGLAAKRGGAVDPNPEAETGGGGPIDEGATGEGKVAQRAEFLPDQVGSRVAITARDIDALEVIRIRNRLKG